MLFCFFFKMLITTIHYVYCMDRDCSSSPIMEFMAVTVTKTVNIDDEFGPGEHVL